MTPSVIVGVDPGLHGAIAGLHAETGDIIWCLDMPTVAGDVAGAVLADYLRGEVISCAAVEQINAMPRQGVSSSFKFGKGYGIVLGVLAALGAPVVHVRPGDWKKAMHLSADKEQGRHRALDRWPASAALFARKKDDGRAEACLLALWAMERRA